MITVKDLEAAKPFTIFQGYQGKLAPVGVRDVDWDIFTIDCLTDEQELEAKQHGVRVSDAEPERINETCERSRAAYDDLDAALDYLASGGMLIKIPDAPGSRYWRLYVCRPL